MRARSSLCVWGGPLPPTPALGRPSPLPPLPSPQPLLPQECALRSHRLRAGGEAPERNWFNQFQPRLPTACWEPPEAGGRGDSSPRPRRRRAPHLRSLGRREARPEPGTAGPRRSKSRAFHSPQCPQSARPAPLLAHRCLRRRARAFLDNCSLSGLLPAVSRQPQASQGFMLTDSFLRGIHVAAVN